MKKILFLLSLIALISCGSKNNNEVDSSSTEPRARTNSLDTLPTNTVINFEGSYDIRRDAPNENCPASINITQGCNGYILSSNTNQNEDFCNVNEGARPIDKNPPLPDRNPPSPDRNPPNPDSHDNVVVTLHENQLKAVVKIGQKIYTNSLTLDQNIYLTKETNYKSRNNTRCFFEKRN